MSLVIASLALGLTIGTILGYGLALLQRIERAAIKTSSGTVRESIPSAILRATREPSPDSPSQPPQVVSPSKKAATSLTGIDS